MSFYIRIRGIRAIICNRSNDQFNVSDNDWEGYALLQSTFTHLNMAAATIIASSAELTRAVSSVDEETKTYTFIEESKSTRLYSLSLYYCSPC
jgi:hypothetical protein